MLDWRVEGTVARTLSGELCFGPQPRGGSTIS